MWRPNGKGSAARTSRKSGGSALEAKDHLHDQAIEIEIVRGAKGRGVGPAKLQLVRDQHGVGADGHGHERARRGEGAHVNETAPQRQVDWNGRRVIGRVELQ